MERTTDNFIKLGRRMARPSVAVWEPSSLSIADLIRQVDQTVAAQKRRLAGSVVA
jgi:hypothetical protein